MTRTHRLRRAALCAALGLGLSGVGGCTREALRPQAATSPEAGSPAAAELAASLAAAAPKRAAAEPPREDSVAQNLAQGHREAEAGRPEQAARFYERVLREDPRNAVAHHRLAVIADQNRDFASAERHYRAALEARPADPDLLNDLGYSYLMQGRHPESERALREAVAAAPRHERAITNLGLLYGTIGDSDRALAVLRMTGTEDEARSKLAILVPRRGGQAGEDSLAPPIGRPVDSPVVAASATSHSAPATASGAAAPTDAARDLMAQLARAGGPPGGQGASGYRLPADRLPGLIDPATAPEGLPRPYTRSQGQVAAKPPLPDTASSAPTYGGAAAPAAGRGAVVTANAEGSVREWSDDLPLWAPPPGTPAPSGPVPSIAVPPQQYASRAPEAGFGNCFGPGPMCPTAGGDPTSAMRGRSSGPLPPPAYSSQPGSPLQGAAYGQVAGDGRFATRAPSRYVLPAGHSTPSLDASAELREYANDLARLEAEAAETRAQLDADRGTPYGAPPTGSYGGATGAFYR